MDVRSGMSGPLQRGGMMSGNAGTRISVIGMVLGLLCLGAGPTTAQDAADLKRLMTRDAVLVSQAIGWSLQGPVSATELVPVSFSAGAIPRPIASGTMFTHNVMLLDYVTPWDEPNRRGLAGVIELTDNSDHRVIARFNADYEVASAESYRVDAVAVTEIYPATPRIEAYVVPAAAFGPAGPSGQSPFAMLTAIRRAAISPTIQDALPRDYRVFVVGMDRLPPQADLGFAAVDATNGRELGGSQSVRENGWIVASLPLTFAMNGQHGVYFAIGYRPDGAAGPARMLMLCSNRYPVGAPSSAEQPKAHLKLPPLPGLPPAPGLSALGQGFVTKSYPNLYVPR